MLGLTVEKETPITLQSFPEVIRQRAELQGLEAERDSLREELHELRGRPVSRHPVDGQLAHRARDLEENALLDKLRDNHAAIAELEPVVRQAVSEAKLAVVDARREEHRQLKRDIITALEALYDAVNAEQALIDTLERDGVPFRDYLPMINWVQAPRVPMALKHTNIQKLKRDNP